MRLRPIKQRARTKSLGRQLVADHVEIVIGACCIPRDLDTEHIGKDVIEPQPWWRAPEQVVIGGGPHRIGVAVRADNGQIGNLRRQSTRNAGK